MEIKDARFVISNTDVSKCPNHSMPEYAFIGRSNVGKSSLINLLMNRTNLAKTSSTPGKTQLINHFIVNNSWHLVDLPGYGYAKVAKSKQATFAHIITDYLTKREQLTNLFVLVDCRHEPQKADLEFFEYLERSEIPFSIIFTKVDKLTPTKLEANLAFYSAELLKQWEELPPIFACSALKRTGREEVLDYIDSINKKL